MIEDFNAFSCLYKENKLFELTLSKKGLYLLKLRSLARKEYYLRVFSKAQISPDNLKAKYFLENIFHSNIFSQIIHNCINEIYKTERLERRQNEDKLLA